MAPEPAPSRPTVHALLGVLADRPDTSAAELAEAAGIGRSTATKQLGALAGQGRVLRRPGGYAGGRRTPDRWTLIATTAQDAATPAATPPAAPAAQAAQADGRDQQPAAGRLRAGELRDLVVDCLAQRPGQPLSPTAIAKTLGRSGGAVANALQALAGQGRVVQAQYKPRRYRLPEATDPTVPVD
jgi:biotin operon repressor